MNIIKYIMHPCRIVKEINWRIKKKQFKFVGLHAKIGLNFSIKGAKNISIGNNFTGADNICLWAWDSYNGAATGQQPELVIGDNVTITEGCVITCLKKIMIGSGVLLGRGTLISDNSHGENKTLKELQVSPQKRALYSKGTVYIGENVWTGANVCIMPGVSIGKGTVIGANSVVTHDLPDYCIAGGIPAKVIRYIEV